MPDIVLDAVTRRFGTTTAVDAVSTVFPEGSVTCLLGPSGCGKTTLMRMIAGLETPTGGRIRFGDRDVTALPPGRRNVAMVFQYPVMYRTLSVAENIDLAMHRDGLTEPADRAARVDDVLDVLDLRSDRRKRIEQLDAGTRQRVAVGRAIARNCDVILFDEPTTNVDMHAKLALIRAFNAFRARMRQTIVYVTHDQTEAMTLADRIALMQSGAITQIADPRTLYERPDSEFAGWFLGTPGMNFLGPAGEDDDAVWFDAVPATFKRPSGGTLQLRAGIRPERVRVDHPGVNRFPARVLRRSITIGGQYLLLLELGRSRLRVRAPSHVGRDATTEVSIECPVDQVTFFQDGARLSEQPQPVR